jgi:murein DD-endopeptidase MepM/ murein hydrolase activator NlpD
MGRAPGEVHQVRRIRCPETVAEVAATGAGAGILLLAAFVVLHAMARPVWLSVVPSRVGAQGAPPSAIPCGLVRGRLRFPVPAVSPAAMSDSFEQARGRRSHLAVDILAPRGSPVVAVDDGTLARLSSSPAGGISVYQLDAAQRHCFFYAHLERYAEGLAEGQPVKRGAVIAYVGTTGNAPPNTPHLHFAIHEVTSPKQCWGGRPVDPYPLWP